MPAKSSVFRCSCGEFIATDAERCRFCTTPVDRQAAETASELQKRVNTAYGEAKLLEWIVLSVLGLYVAINITLLFRTDERHRKFLLTEEGNLLFLVPAVLCALAIIVLILGIVRWRSKYGSFETDNPDMKEAKSVAHTAFIFWWVLCGALALFSLFL